MSLFSSIRVKSPKKTAFNLSHEVKGSYKLGYLYPTFCKPVVPGDRFQLQSEIMMRFTPLISPVMHRMNVYTYSFFVPMRLIFDDWEDFITAGVDGEAKPIYPYLKLDEYNSEFILQTGGLADYMGVPSDHILDNEKSTNINSAMFRAYQLIYNEYFRDQNLEDPVPIYTGEGEEPFNYVDEKGKTHAGYPYTLTTLRKKAWEKDYFTSALPWTQRGPDSRIPITALNDGNIVLDNDQATATQGSFRPVGSATTTGAGGAVRTDENGGILIEQDNIPTQAVYDPNGSLRIEGQEILGSTINELRRSYAIQRWLEKNALAGSRYIEQILSHFGVRTSDYRLQRPQFLGAGSSPVVISEVLQTSQSTVGEDGSPQGTMAGHGISVGNTHGFKSTRFEEHGFIIQLMCVIPRTQYFQGLDRMFTVRDNLDFYWPEFAHLGEQPVRNDELFWQPNADSSVNGGTFGYQSRYAEYKWYPSTVHGEFRKSLDYWHMARKFENLPQLNKEFVESNPATRIFAVEQDAENLYCQIFHNCKALRPMPRYGTPML